MKKFLGILIFSLIIFITLPAGAKEISDYIPDEAIAYAKSYTEYIRNHYSSAYEHYGFENENEAKSLELTYSYVLYSLDTLEIMEGGIKQYKSFSELLDRDSNEYLFIYTCPSGKCVNLTIRYNNSKKDYEFYRMGGPGETLNNYIKLAEEIAKQDGLKTKKAMVSCFESQQYFILEGKNTHVLVPIDYHQRRELKDIIVIDYALFLKGYAKQVDNINEISKEVEKTGVMIYGGLMSAEEMFGNVHVTMEPVNPVLSKWPWSLVICLAVIALCVATAKIKKQIHSTSGSFSL